MTTNILTDHPPHGALRAVVGHGEDTMVLARACDILPGEVITTADGNTLKVNWLHLTSASVTVHETQIKWLVLDRTEVVEIAATVPRDVW